jgi:hypothetical protein
MGTSFDGIASDTTRFLGSSVVYPKPLILSSFQEPAFCAANSPHLSIHVDVFNQPVLKSKPQNQNLACAPSLQLDIAMLNIAGLSPSSENCSSSVPKASTPSSPPESVKLSPPESVKLSPDMDIRTDVGKLISESPHPLVPKNVFGSPAVEKKLAGSWIPCDSSSMSPFALVNATTTSIFSLSSSSFTPQTDFFKSISHSPFNIDYAKNIQNPGFIFASSLLGNSFLFLAPVAYALSSLCRQPVSSSISSSSVSSSSIFSSSISSLPCASSLPPNTSPDESLLPPTSAYKDVK